LDTVGLNKSRGMRVQWEQGEVDAGSLKLGFGRNPNAYMSKQIRPNDDFREIYYRMYLKMQTGWQGNPYKLSRATVFTSSTDWSQAMIGHLWSDGNGHLLIDPASCVNNSSVVECVGYNDFTHLQWLGNKSGLTPIFTAGYDNQWYCVEAHVKLNDPGQSNGVQEFWINGQLEAQRTGLAFVKSYTSYAINGVFIENYWNTGSPKAQERYIDNIAVSTAPIGCLSASNQTETHTPIQSAGFSLFPNPLTNRGTFAIAAPLFSGQATLTFYNSLGRIAARFTVHLLERDPYCLPNLENGLYVAVLRMPGRTLSRAVVILK
jgi:hypothetical protein